MYCINYLARSDVPTCDILCVYCLVIRSVLEHACAVWHPALTKNYLKILMSVFKSVAKSYSIQPCHTIRH